MYLTDRRSWLKSLVCALLAFSALAGCALLPVSLSDKAYHHLVVLGDPHLPGRNLNNKNQALARINSWPDVEAVVAVGDICADFGTDAEYEAAKEFFAKLQIPLMVITGNHDFVYESPSGTEGPLVNGSKSLQEVKLRKFRETFSLQSYFYSRRIGNFLLLFLSADSSEFLAGMSDDQLTWLRSELENNRKTPTIIFFHAPLQGTLRNYRHFINTPAFIAQPADQLHEILTHNKQVFLWVSGHTHTSPLEESFASPINLYAGQITNIHNKDLNRETIWTNSLFLYPDKVLVKTYNHQENKWLSQFDRSIAVPQL